MFHSKIVGQQFTDAALCALFSINAEPSAAAIETATGDSQTYGEVANRLVGTRGLTPKTYANGQEVFGPIVLLLAGAGWTLSGSGYFSLTFIKGGLALKIGLKKDQDAALDYLAWCCTMPAMPGLPTVFSLTEYEYTYAVLMDRYESIAGEVKAKSPLYDPHIASEFEEVKAGVSTGICGEFATSETAALIHRTFVGQACFDIHAGNVMLNRKGGMVISDPLGHSKVANGPLPSSEYTSYYDYDSYYSADETTF